MHLSKVFYTAVCFSTILLLSCSENPTSNLGEQGKNGGISVNLSANPSSEFSALAYTAEIRISADGMIPIIEPLAVTINTISGSVSGILAGPNRMFEVFVYDKSQGICYYGSAVSSVTAGGMANISLTLRRTDGLGGATINGTIESGPNLPPTISIISPTNGAQFDVEQGFDVELAPNDPEGEISLVRLYLNNSIQESRDAPPWILHARMLAPGTYQLRAIVYDIAGASAEASITVTTPGIYNYRINAGGNAVSPYIVDQFFSGGALSSTNQSITISGIQDPAPMSVYQTERYGNFSYTMPNLTAGKNYKVRLHFAEIYWSSAGQRKFNVSINGNQVLSNFDIFVAAGGAKRALVREFYATANNNGQIQIVLTTLTDNAQICGIDITQ